MKIISILHTTYITILSAMLAWSAIFGSFKFMFNSPLCYGIHIVVSIFLVLICAVILFVQVKEPTTVRFYQAIWWTPQLILLVYTKFNIDKTRGTSNSLYHYPMGYHFSPHLGWEIKPNEFFFLHFNVIALVGIIIALITVFGDHGQRIRIDRVRNEPRSYLVVEQARYI